MEPTVEALIEEELKKQNKATLIMIASISGAAGFLLCIASCAFLWRYHKKSLAARKADALAQIEFDEDDPAVRASIVEALGGDAEELYAEAALMSPSIRNERSSSRADLMVEKELFLLAKERADLEATYKLMEKNHEARMYRLTKNFIGRLSSDTVEREKAKQELVDILSSPKVAQVARLASSVSALSSTLDSCVPGTSATSASVPSASAPGTALAGDQVDVQLGS